DGIRDFHVTGVQTCALPILAAGEPSALRGFLRFLAMDGRVRQGLVSQIDTPRLYQFEQLPRTLPWETVRALLRSIDRTSAMGLRSEERRVGKEWRSRWGAEE